MKTRSELVTEFRDWIDQQNTAIISTTIANREINRAYKQLIGMIASWNDRYYLGTGSISTTASTQYVAVPSDCVMVKRLVDSDNYELRHLDLEQFDLSLSNGEPVGWDKTGQYVRFNPIPDAIYTYTIYYTKMPTELSTDGATPDFVPGYEGLIALKAALNSKMIRDENVQEMAQLTYLEDIKNLRHVVVTQQTGGGSRVVDSNYDLTLR